MSNTAIADALEQAANLGDLLEALWVNASPDRVVGKLPGCPSCPVPRLFIPGLRRPDRAWAEPRRLDRPS